MIVISSIPKESDDYYKKYDRSDEYIETSMQTMLDSTVPEAIYHYNDHGETRYIGQKIENIIILDLNIRSTGSGKFNQSNLEAGIEQEIRLKIESILGIDIDYIFIASGGSDPKNGEIEAELIISNIAGGSLPDIEAFTPVYEKHFPISTTAETDTDIGEVLIELYII
jgi:carbamoylphosphate synthase small subunit